MATKLSELMASGGNTNSRFGSYEEFKSYMDAQTGFSEEPKETMDSPRFKQPEGVPEDISFKPSSVAQEYNDIKTGVFSEQDLVNLEKNAEKANTLSLPKESLRALGNPAIMAANIATKSGVLKDAPQDIAETAVGIGQSLKARGSELAKQTSDVFNSDKLELSSFGAVPAATFGALSDVIGGLVIGAGKTLLPQEAEDQIAQKFQEVTGEVMDSELAKTVVQKWNELPEESKELFSQAGAVGEFVADVVGVGIAGKGLKAGKGVFDTVELPESVKNIKTETPLGKELAKSAMPEKNTFAGGIVQRMNRVTPTQSSGFAKASGTEMGEWLVQRGIIGSPEETVNVLYDRMKKSMEQADIAMSKIEGRFKDKSIDGAIEQLVELEASLAKKGGKSKDAKVINRLASKNRKDGLTMSEINQLKRLYERKVKTEYIRDTNKTSVDVQAATNLDSNLRQWQRETAESMGLENLKDINKETMLSKMAADAIGERHLRAAGNNAVTITDWIAAAPAATNPAALSLVVGKKLVASDIVQTYLAKSLRKGEIVEIPKADIDKIERKAKLLNKKAELAKTAKEKARIQKEKERIDRELENALIYNKQLALPSGEGTIPSGDVVNVKPIAPRSNVDALQGGVNRSKTGKTQDLTPEASKTETESSPQSIPETPELSKNNSKSSAKAKTSGSIEGMDDLPFDYKISEMDIGGRKRFVVESSSDPLNINASENSRSLFTTKKEAIEEINREMKNKEYREGVKAEREKEEANVAKKEERLNNFLSQYSDLGRGRGEKVLKTEMRINGKLGARYELIEGLVNDGYTPYSYDGKSFLLAPNATAKEGSIRGGFLEEKDITKYGMDYAKQIWKEANKK